MVTIDERINNFINYRSDSNTFLEKAAKEYVMALDENVDKKEVRNIFIQKAQVSGNTLDVLESVGRNERDVRLLHQTTLIIKNLERLPIKIQREILDQNHIKFYDGNSHRCIPLNKLTEKDWEQVYDSKRNEIRDVNEQRNYVFFNQGKQVKLDKKCQKISIANKKKNTAKSIKGYAIIKEEKKVYIHTKMLKSDGDNFVIDISLIKKIYDEVMKVKKEKN